MKNYVSYSDATQLMTAIANKIAKLGCYKFKGSVAFASLPATLTASMDGYVYNITDDFTTDSRFIEGAGKKYNAGANIAVADLSTYDAVTPQAGDNPSTEGWYELVSGKYVLSEDTTVDAGKTYYEYNELAKFDVLGEFIDLDAIYDVICKEDFDATQAYEIGDVVMYNNVLYRFKAAHAANDPWDPTEVDEVDVVTLIGDAEPESLTPEQIQALIDLLG